MNSHLAWDNGYTDELWDLPSARQRRHYLREFTDLKYIVGWAEQTQNGWIGMVRDDQGMVRRAACVRTCQQDAIHAARSMVAELRTEQIRLRRLYVSEYKTFWKPHWTSACAA